MKLGLSVDLYYFSNHDTISQLRGTVSLVGTTGVELTDVTDGRTSFFPWTSVQRCKYVEEV